MTGSKVSAALRASASVWEIEMNQHVGHQDPGQAGQATSVCQQQGAEQRTEFSERQMEAFMAMPYKRPSAERLLRDRANLNDPFHAHLLQLSYDSSVPYNAIMEEFCGSPLWVEFKHKTHDRWAFILPDLYVEGRYRVQFFDLDGMIRHHGSNSLFEAVETMVVEGYVTKAAGKLDELSATNRWKRGTEFAGLITKLNTKQITSTEFYVLQQAAIDAYPC
jgi:hypothetical protein